MTSPERRLTDTEFVSELLERAQSQLGSDSGVNFHIVEHAGDQTSSGAALASISANQDSSQQRVPTPQNLVWAVAKSASVTLADVWQHCWLSTELPSTASVGYESAHGGWLVRLILTAARSDVADGVVMDRLIGHGWLDLPEQSETTGSATLVFGRGADRLQIASGDGAVEVVLTAEVPDTGDTPVSPIDIAYLPKSIKMEWK